MSKIKNIQAREVLDSRGYPTVEVEVFVSDTKHPGETVIGRAIVPSGASTGENEALELRDGDAKRYQGKGVLKAVKNIQEKITPALLNRSFPLQSLLDDALLDLDGSANKSKLGANAILAVSMAFTRAHAAAQQMTTSRSLASVFGSAGTLLPVPMMNILNGGKHADNGLAIQEFMIIPAGFKRFSEALRAGAEIFHRLKKILHERGLSTAVGDEGGFAPQFEGSKPHEQALMVILQAVSEAGYKAGHDVYLALDVAASEIYDVKNGYLFEGKKKSAEDMVGIYKGWLKDFPIISIEDGLSENDWEGWGHLTEVLGERCQLIGDDIFVTNPIFLKKGIEKNVANSVLIKLNQIGTVTETLETMKMAAQADFNCIVSHRSGETEDTFIADLALATDCGQIKTGSASRTDRIAKYNELLRLEESLGDAARFTGAKIYERFLE